MVCKHYFYKLYGLFDMKGIHYIGNLGYALITLNQILSTSIKPAHFHHVFKHKMFYEGYMNLL